MPVPVQKFREVVFQMLYSQDIGKASDEHMLELLSNELAVSKKCVREALDRVKQIQQHLPEIDSLITKTSHSYEFERIQSVERNILRLATYEMLFDKQIPYKVAVAEALRLARKFSTKESASFVNAILDAIYKSTQGQPVDAQHIKQKSDTLAESEAAAHKASQEKKLKDPRA